MAWQQSAATNAINLDRQENFNHQVKKHTKPYPHTGRLRRCVSDRNTQQQVAARVPGLECTRVGPKTIKQRTSRLPDHLYRRRLF